MFGRGPPVLPHMHGDESTWEPSFYAGFTSSLLNQLCGEVIRTTLPTV